MDPHTRHADIRGDGEVGEPQVLDLCVGEYLLDEGVEPEAGHHAGVRVGEVQHHPPLLRHLEAEAAGLDGQLANVPLLAPQRPHEGTYGDPRHPVYRDTSL